MVLLLAVCHVTVQRVPIFEALPYMPQRVWGQGHLAMNYMEELVEK